jgi:mono/diheme cytochrome c family protein
MLASCVAGGGGRTSRPESGAHLYRVSCSGCHGMDARGNGPVAPFLNVPVPDLTRIASRRGGTFPADEIYRIVDGQSDLLSHGPRHMPVWGYEFFGDDPDDEVAHRQATNKVERLVGYLQSIQRAD